MPMRSVGGGIGLGDIFAIPLTEGSIPIVNAEGKLIEDNTNLNYNDTTKKLHLKGDTLEIGTVVVEDMGGCLATKEFHAHGRDGVSGYLKIKQGTTPAAHKEADHSILWVDSSEKLYLEKIDGTDLEISRLAAALTQGSIPFVDANGMLAQDNAKLFWDNVNKRLGIGTLAPKRQFDFGGGDVRTQRYTDSDLSTNLGYETFGAGNLSGEHNSGFGRQALYSVTSGGNNCAFGSGALYGITTGNSNIAMGYNAGKSITEGDHNISLGYKSGYVTGTGNNNISIGAYTNYVGTGSKNITIGYNIDLPADAGDNQLNIGNLIFGTDVDGVDKGISTGKIGLGVVSPAERLDVDGSIKVSGNLTDGTNSLTVANAKSAYNHISLTNNPHSVTKSQVGLGSVPNTNIAYASAISADDFNQTEVDNLRAGKLDDGTTPWLGRYSYSQHPATTTWTSSGQVNYMEIRYYLQRWQYKIMHGGYGAAYIRNFRLSDANPYTTQHDVNPTINTWYYFSSDANYDSLYDAGDYVELRIYSDNSGFQGVVTVKAMRNGNNLIAFTLSQGVVE